MRKPTGVVVSLSSLRGKHNRGGGGGARKSEEEGGGLIVSRRWFEVSLLSV